MYAADHPKELKVERPAKTEAKVASVESEVAWAEVLVGEAYDRLMAKHLPPEAVLRRLRGEVALPEGALVSGTVRMQPEAG